MQKLLLTVVDLAVFSTSAMAQDAPRSNWISKTRELNNQWWDLCAWAPCVKSAMVRTATQFH